MPDFQGIIIRIHSPLSFKRQLVEEGCRLGVFQALPRIAQDSEVLEISQSLDIVGVENVEDHDDFLRI